MRTKFVFSVITVFLFLAPFALAGIDISQSELNFGSDNQEKQNEAAPIVLNKTFEVDFSGGIGVAYENVDYTFTEANNFPSGNVEVNGLQSMYSPNGSTITESIAVEVTIPDDFDSVDESLDKTEFVIGTLEIMGDESVNGSTTGTTDSDSLELSLEVKNGVSLVKVELVKEDDSTSSISGGSTITVKAEEDLEFVFFVKNEYMNESEFALAEVTIMMDIDSYEDDEISVTNVDPQEEEDEKLEFSFDEDDADTYDVLVKITSEDEGDGFHGLEFEFELDVQEPDADPIDEDNDGVDDSNDQCLLTIPGCEVDGNGCAKDSDNDGLCDGLDIVDNNPDPDPDPDPDPNPNPQQATNTINAAGTSDDDDPDDDTEKIKEKDDGDGSAFLPFVIGFLVGAVVASGFFLLLKV